MTRDMLLRALRSATDDEARAIWEALGQYVENEQCDTEVESDDPHDEKPLLAAAEAVLDRMNAEIAALAGSIAAAETSTPSPAVPTKAQRRVLESATSNGGRTYSGRNGWSTNTLRAMEKRGWVRLVKKHTWETDWEVTDAGRAALAATKGA